MPMINEAFFCMMEGVGTPEDIDRGMRLGTNAALGPLKLADAIGGYGSGVGVWRCRHGSGPGQDSTGGVRCDRHVGVSVWE